MWVEHYLRIQDARSGRWEVFDNVAQESDESILTMRKPRRFARAWGYSQGGGSRSNGDMVAPRPPTVKVGGCFVFDAPEIGGL